MKLFTKLLVAILIVSVPVAGKAADLKIGYIVTPRLISESKIGKDASSELKGKLEAAQKALDKKLSEIKDLEKDIQRRSVVLSDDERKKAMDQHELELREAKRMREDNERKLSKDQQALMAHVNEVLRGVIEDYAKAEKFDVILDATTLLYISQKADVTDAVIALADKRYKK